MWAWIFVISLCPIVWRSPTIDPEKKKARSFALSMWEKERQTKSSKERRMNLRTAIKALSLQVGFTSYWVALFLAYHNYKEGKKPRTELPCTSHILKGASNAANYWGPCPPLFSLLLPPELTKKRWNRTMTIGLHSKPPIAHQTRTSVYTHLILILKRNNNKRLNRRGIIFLENAKVVRNLWSLLKTKRKEKEKRERIIACVSISVCYLHLNTSILLAIHVTCNT